MEISLHNENTGMMAAEKVLNCNINGMICDLMSGCRTTDERKFKVYILHCNLLGVRLDVEVDADSRKFKNDSVNIELVRKIFDEAMDSSVIIRLMEESFENGRKLGENTVKKQFRNLLGI